MAGHVPEREFLLSSGRMVASSSELRKKAGF